ncbi:MAG: hypothetical protein ABI220_04875 [Candidatus Saccharimonadales bacterium]
MKKLTILRTPILILVLATFIAVSYLTTAVALGVPVTPPAGSTFDQRLDQRKKEQNEQLDAKTVKHLQSVCGTEQLSIRKLQPWTATVANKRTTTYQNVDGILLISIGQLKLASQKTFELEQDRAALVQKITTFQDTFANYQQVLGDILVINCQADPIGFQALLDTARVYYTQLISQSGDIATYVNNVLQPVMQNFVGILQPKSNTDS